MNAIENSKRKTASRRDLIARLHACGNPERARVSKSFFKTGPGEYGEGDRFVGASVPQMRSLARDFESLGEANVLKLLHSKIHEERVVALLILVRRFQRGVEEERGAIVTLYLGNTAFVNNWDLVDCSAPYILGPYLETRSRKLLPKLARSKSLWDRRIAILATFHFIRQNDFTDALAIAEILLHDEHDLIHKAVGWMLREVGKRDIAAERAFLDAHAATMPRTMLRYAIERFDEAERKRYLGMAKLQG